MTSAELRDHYSIKPIQLERWCKRGCPHTKVKGDRVFDPAQVQEWLANAQASRAPGQPEDTSSESLDLKVVQARKTLAQAKLAEIKLGHEQGKMVLRADVERENVRKFTTIRNRLLGLPASLAPLLEGKLAPAIQAELDARIRTILNELSRT